MSSDFCYCTSDDVASCSGGGLPRTWLGECSCGCHRPALRERWPLAMRAAAPTGPRYVALGLRTHVYELGAYALDLADDLRPRVLDAIARVVDAWSTTDRAAALRVLETMGLAQELTAARVRLAVAQARERLAWRATRLS